MVLAENVDGGDDLDLIVTTMSGNVYCFQTPTPHHPLKVRVPTSFDLSTWLIFFFIYKLSSTLIYPHAAFVLVHLSSEISGSLSN